MLGSALQCPAGCLVLLEQVEMPAHVSHSGFVQVPGADRCCSLHLTVNSCSLPWLSAGLAGAVRCCWLRGGLPEDSFCLLSWGLHNCAFGLAAAFGFLMEWHNRPCQGGVTYSKPLPVKLCKPEDDLEVTGNTWQRTAAELVAGGLQASPVTLLSPAECKACSI